MNRKSDYIILFVDDEEKTLKNFVKVIGSNYEVLTATNIQDAQTILDEQYDKIGVLITDQRMPGGNGVKLLTYAQKEYPLIVRMLITGFSDLADAIDAINKGEIFKYLSKPWDIHGLQTDIRAAMQFFELAKDREQLIKEKLSVLNKSAGVDGIKQLIAIAHGHPALSSIPHALQELLSTLINQHNPEAVQNGSHHDFWEMAINQTNIMSAVAEKLANYLGDISDTQDTIKKADWESTLDKLGISYTGDIPEISGSKQHIESIPKAISDLANMVKQDKASINVEFSEVDKAVQLKFNIDNASELNRVGQQALIGGAETANETASYLATLLSIFLLAYDHSGKAQIKASEDTLKITILLADYSSDEQAIDANWIEDLLVQYS